MKKLLVAGALLALAATPAPGASRTMPPLTLLVTHGRDAESALVLVDAAALATGRLPPPIARVAHLPDAAVRGVLAPDGTVLVVADRAPGHDRSWGSSLLAVAPGQAPRELCDRVDYASRPLVLASGTVLVARGRAGTPRPGTLRIDELTIDAVDLASGVTRTVWRGTGYQAHLAAAHGNEAIVYHVDEHGAELLAVDTRGRARMLAPSLLPFARDFTIQGDRLVFAERDERRSDLWVVDAIDLASGARIRLQRSASAHAAPFQLASGRVAVAADGHEGIDVLRARSADGAYVAGWHYPPGAPQPDLIVSDGEARPLGRIAAPPATRLEIVGFGGTP